MYAGAGSAIWKLGRGFMNGILEMRSAAPVNVTEEVPEIQPRLLLRGLRISAFFNPGNRPPEEMPGNAGEILRAAEKFRARDARHA